MKCLKKIAAIGSALMMAMLAFGSAPVFAENEIENKIEDITSFTYKLFDDEKKYEQELEKQMNRVYTSIQDYILDDEIMPIPGIINTCFLENGKVKRSKYYVPQGICFTEEYIIMTAYHDSKSTDEIFVTNKDWKSVIFVIDKESREYISTLSLPHNYHNGGIAYDGYNIWFCGNTKDAYYKEGNESFVQYMKADRLEELLTAEDCEITNEDLSEPVYISNKPSFLEADNGILWVGTYKNNEPDEYDGYAIGYTIEDIDSETPSLNTLDVRRLNNIASSCQGMEIYGDDCYISSSGHGNQNWIQSSFVTRYDISKINNGKKILDLKDAAEKSIEVPKMNEEIVVDDKAVYILFEASAESFLKNASKGMKTDRVLVIDKTLWE